MQALAITGVHVWDGLAERRSPATAIVRVERGRIAAIGAEPALAAGARVVHLPGATALPGLIDAHVHLTLDPAVGAPEEQEARDPALRSTQMEERAAAMLRAGITTARDLGGALGLELELRDRIARGECAGPRLLCAGQPLTCPGGHTHYWGGEASGPDQIRAVVRRQLERGADWIKVMATGGVLTRGFGIAHAQFSEDELALAVETAGDGGRAVAAHCHGSEGIRRAAVARVRTIEHCSFASEDGFGAALDPRVVDAVAASGAWVSPTVNAGWRRFLDARGERGRWAERMHSCFRALVQAGVPFIASTDAGIPRVEHWRLPEALAVFERFAGLRPVEVLRAATSSSASALGLADELGVLRPGLAADLLVVDGDPLSDLSALRHPRLVVARGELCAGVAGGLSPGAPASAAGGFPAEP